MYEDRYGHRGNHDWSVIPNGYDEAAFVEAESLVASRSKRDTPLTLVHSGLLDPSDRDPLPFLDALAKLRDEGTICSGRVCVILRATNHDDLYRPEIVRRKLDDIVFLKPAVAYVDALAEMMMADGLLLFQGSSCNHQIPAKLYEYFRAHRPLLCIADPTGDTAMAARAAGVKHIFPWNDRVVLTSMLRAFIVGEPLVDELLANEDVVIGSSRRGHAEQLAEILDRVTKNRAVLVRSDGERN